MSSQPSSAPSHVDTLVGNYRITRKVSQGGMGSVYHAEHVLIGKAAAVKILHPEFSGNKDIVNRFFNEAKATTSIHHPGIVEVFDYGYLPNGDGYLVMEFLDGMSLARRLRAPGRFTEGEVAMLLRGVCGALAAAHAKGIVHRDLKPDNIFLVPDPESPLGLRPKLLDFGIAKLTDVGLAGSATKTGAVMGTPSYMSPEQCKGTGEVDHRADLYSIGCILYELMCRRPPFTARGSGELIGAHLYVQPNPPSEYEPTITPAMEKLIIKLLDKEPDRRVQTANELAHKLGEIAASHDFQIKTLTPIPGTFRASQLPMQADAPVSRTEFAPDIEITPPGTEAVAADDKPTTLSSAASHSVIRPDKKRKRLVAIGAVLVAACVIGGVGFVLGQGGGTAPATTTTTVVVPAAKPPAPPVLARPAPPPPPPTVVETAAPTPPVAPPPPIVKRTITPKQRHPNATTTTPPQTPVKPADKKIDGPIETDI